MELQDLNGISFPLTLAAQNYVDKLPLDRDF